MVHLWLMEGKRCVPLHLLDMSALDSVTRALPDGFYTTFRTYGLRTRVLGLQSHLDRLYRPSRRMGIQPTMTPDGLRTQLASLLSDFPSQEVRVRVIISVETEPGTLYTAIEPLQTPPPAIYRDGVRVATTSAQRDHPALKTTSFIEESQGERRRLVETRIYEGLIVRNGRILEGITSNFFYVMVGKLCTARGGVLNGVTRRQVLRLAVGQGIPLAYRALKFSQMNAVDEAFLTSSSRGIVPINTIDKVRVGAGRVGEWTRRLTQAYVDDVEQRAEPIVSARPMKSPQPV